MIPYSQLFVIGHTQSAAPAPSWMGIDNFVDFVLPSRTNSLYQKLVALFRK